MWIDQKNKLCFQSVNTALSLSKTTDFVIFRNFRPIDQFSLMTFGLTVYIPCLVGTIHNDPKHKSAGKTVGTKNITLYLIFFFLLSIILFLIVKKELLKSINIYVLIS